MDIVNLFNPEEFFSGGGGSGAGSARGQGLAETLIADYTFPARAWLPSTAIVVLLGEFGVASAAARTTISRMARRGVLERSRQGRYSSYRLTQEAATGLWTGGGLIAAFTTQPDSWDGLWTLVSFSVPEEESTRRRALRTALRGWGYAPLYDAVWLSPFPLTPEARRDLTGVAPGSMSVFRARHVDLDAQLDRHPLEAWDLSAIAAEYEAFIKRWGSLLPSVADGSITGAAAVRARTELMDTYRHFFPTLDPLLPAELLPSDWPRARAREVCIAVYDGLAQQAQEHVRAVVARFADGSHGDIRAHTIAGMSAGVSSGRG
ncbi:PaaX family transcriptional regulator C-terminal domain-containing protein [Actinocrinis sp.]|uniref:PaaX family transcriptional regulator n=1 Tax=Actinocrinis sp. TaxID=1920516 RepID=UPI002B97C43C|nr:PaaX family transcriptional regulator C-terminal domain-containing protein [Actinocrinis sp.]HXR74173.1 PaaX family transcriptional regulator C-terminal domain-containing protein [Actinocrinis sp.]